MATKYRAFTIRLPEDLADQIEQRAYLTRISKNTAITRLLIKALDKQVKNDLKLLKT